MTMTRPDPGALLELVIHWKLKGERIFKVSLDLIQFMKFISRIVIKEEEQRFLTPYYSLKILKFD